MADLPSVRERERYIRDAAIKRGIDPDIAVRVAKSEGLASGVWQSNVTKNGRREPSYGPFQMLVGGPGTGFPKGLGNAFIKATGLHPKDPKNVFATIDFALNSAVRNGWGAWFGAKKVGVSKWAGLRNAKPAPINATPANLDAGMPATGPIPTPRSVGLAMAGLQPPEKYHAVPALSPVTRAPLPPAMSRLSPIPGQGQFPASTGPFGAASLAPTPGAGQYPASTGPFGPGRLSPTPGERIQGREIAMPVDPARFGPSSRSMAIAPSNVPDPSRFGRTAMGPALAAPSRERFGPSPALAASMAASSAPDPARFGRTAIGPSVSSPLRPDNFAAAGPVGMGGPGGIYVGDIPKNPRYERIAASTLGTNPPTQAAPKTARVGLPPASSPAQKMIDAYTAYGASRAAAPVSVPGEQLPDEFAEFAYAPVPGTMAPSGVPDPARFGRTAMGPETQPTYTPSDIYGGQIGSALDNTGQNTVSRDQWGNTSVTNRFGATTAMTPGGYQAAQYGTGAATDDGPALGPRARGIGGTLAGGALGGLAGGPLGAALGALLGRELSKPGGGVVGGFLNGTRNIDTSKVGPSVVGGQNFSFNPNTAFARSRPGLAFPDAPAAPLDLGRRSNLTERERRERGREISPRAQDAIDRGRGGLY